MPALPVELDLRSQARKENFAVGLVVKKRSHNQQLASLVQVLEGASHTENTCKVLSYSLTWG